MFGFGKGKITIKLDKYQFNQGEEISGKVTVKMKKAVEANELNVTLMGRETVSSRGFDGKQTSQTNTICDDKLTLDGAKPYSASQMVEKEFKIKIPVVQAKDPENKVLGTALKVARMATRSRSKQKWWLRARLDVPGLDVRSKRARIVVNPAPSQSAPAQNI